MCIEILGGIDLEEELVWDSLFGILFHLELRMILSLESSPGTFPLGFPPGGRRSYLSLQT